MSKQTIQPWLGLTEVPWSHVLKSNIELGSHYKVVPTEGYLAWEYNPLRNYRLSQNMYEKDGKYYTLDEFLELNPDIKQQVEANEEPKDLPNGWTLRESGELVDFITNELSFNLQHPVEILPQYSYDGSVNLILNDGLNIPRLINSRFTVTGRNTYKVIDRKGDNDTNIYDQGEQFDVDTSLFKNVNKIPKLEYLGTSTGNMKIGNYHFYFKYSDADGNESDWVAESGLVSVFIGGSPMSSNTGIRDENSIKSVRFILSNIDIGYSFVKVYYTRYSADIDGNFVVSAKKIDKNFLVNNSGTCTILITGDENETEVTLEEINDSYDTIQNAQTQCSAANRLFMANIHKSKIEYDILSKLSLCFCPYKVEEQYPLSKDGIDENYNISSISDGYYDSKYIYDKTGYWPGELYRLGIVYILKDGSLSPVFNIRGATNLHTKTDEILYKIEKDFKSDKPLKEILEEIDYSEENFMIIGGTAPNENAKGVIQLSSEYESNYLFPIYSIRITSNFQIIEELKKYCKGFFFVRQKRMPLTLCQGIVVGLDKESRTPTLPTIAGSISQIDFNNSFIETSNINDINFISEGFLSHYKYDYDRIKDGTGKKILKAIGVVAILAAAAVVTVFTCGAGAVAIGAGLAAMAGAGAGLVGASIGTIATVAGGVAIAASAGIGANTIIQRNRQERIKGEVMELKGRAEKIPEGYERKEHDNSRNLTHDLIQRYIIKDPSKNTPEAIIVPDYQVNQPYYNQFFTGNDFIVKLINEQPITNGKLDGYVMNNDRHFYVDTYEVYSDNDSYNVKLVGVPDGCPVKMIGENIYRGRAGYPEEAYKYEFQGKEYEDSINKRDNSDIIRGNFGSYVGMSGYDGHSIDQISIMIPGYQDNKLFQYIQLRAQDTSSFYAISDRIDINNLNQNNSILEENVTTNQDFDQIYYRGDCYICQYTHRIIRNFNDPSAPYNDKIIDKNSWKDNYDPDKPEKYEKINLGDVNAVQLGLWLTFKVRSSYNLNIRTIDKSHVDEALMSGNYRSFYPHYGQLATGNQKIPDSDQYNKGFSKSVSEKYYFEVPDVPYIKQEFQNRIVFSDIHINDAYKNGFRVLRTMNHKDYPMTYGSITKLVELQNSLLVIFEHGIGLIKIDNSSEHPSQILSDLTVISDTYGSQWKDSILKTPSGVYGVDTVAKKIWRVRNGKPELISDTRVQEFLNQNISLSERELTPILGIRNVKTHYNAFKHDIMFTFYDNLYGTHEKSWNLCYNEILQIFTTFYSWIPSEMQNIDNIPFSFDRNTSKYIAKLGISDHGNDFSEGVTLSNNILYINKQGGFTIKDTSLHVNYVDKEGNIKEYEFDQNSLDNIVKRPEFIGFLYLDNRNLPKEKHVIKYELQRDNLDNYKLFEIKEYSVTVINNNVKSIPVQYLSLKDYIKPKELLSELYYRNKEGNYGPDIDKNKYPDNGCPDPILVGYPIFVNKNGKRLMLPEKDRVNEGSIVRYLNIKANIYIEGEDYNEGESYNDNNFVNFGYFESQVAITTDHNLSLLSTDFWKHGQAGIIDITDKIYPTYWYGKQHPFEFECIVVDNPSVHKIFTNLELIANHVKPESFHYEVIGDVYDFAEDKPTMYFRQEALKALYQYNGYNIEYNPNFLEIEPKQHNRSADLPRYYSRIDTINEIYDSYKRFSAPIGFNYDHLAGAEIVYYPTRNEFRIWNHVEAIDIDSYTKDGIETSIIKANCRYLEDKWLVSINPIVVTYKNELGPKENDLFDETSCVGTGKFIKDKYGIYKYSTWVKSRDGKSLLPPMNIRNTILEQEHQNNIEFPDINSGLGKDNALYGLYDLTQWNQGDWKPIDPTKNKDRRETDVRGKFIKIRIRYSGEELAIIDFLNTIYQISFA